MNTTENNKLIAEFMDWEVVDNQGTLYVDCNPNRITAPLQLLDYIFFDWNYLMEVVKECEKIRLNSSIYATKYDELMELIINGLQQVDITLVYKSCIEFIKWYNQQNQK